MKSNKILKDIMDRAMREIEVINLCHPYEEMTQANLTTLRINERIINFINTPATNLIGDPDNTLKCLKLFIRSSIKRAFTEEKLLYKYWLSYLNKMELE